MPQSRSKRDMLKRRGPLVGPQDEGLTPMPTSAPVKSKGLLGGHLARATSAKAAGPAKATEEPNTALTNLGGGLRQTNLAQGQAIGGAQALSPAQRAQRRRRIRRV